MHQKNLLPTMALLMCGVSASNVAAELVVRNINETVSNASFEFDLNQDGFADFRIDDSGNGGSLIVPLFGSNSPDLLPVIFLGIEDPTQINVFQPGQAVGASEEPSIHFPVPLAGTPDLFFTEIGSTGYVGLALIDNNENQFFGWAQISRGSTIVGQVGFQTTPNTPATIPVPEPTSLGLVLVSLTGLLRSRPAVR